ncbi:MULTISPECIES: hypothetical protein [unclassified Frankia]|nr:MULTISPECIES: hypothetical protein [unclassified Frankia]
MIESVSEIAAVLADAVQKSHDTAVRLDRIGALTEIAGWHLERGSTTEVARLLAEIREVVAG